MAPRITVHPQQRGTWLGFLGRGVCLLTGGAIGFSFTNPDSDTAYELFPVHSQQTHVHVSKLYIDKADEDTAIEKLKDLHRFFQQQQGYLYSRLLKLDDSSNSDNSGNSILPRFVTVSSWLTPRDYSMAWSRAAALGLPQRIPQGPLAAQQGGPRAMLYKKVADDSEYSPTA
ncbi:uncharacterized protein LOC34620548 [Cyclospora cayetanensis]|uniref:Uncharacterized protein n=2 Tax=Cyclospora cayetanensis TaxID=88456 RepID=A0A1D3CTH5_9EIME|nr:uncharacterized protein LOC34620548 [Cyclospora cayetanensis]OEH74495.1 hypothetical protein cyc_03939 [Cyclospora cayetanensis]